MSKRYSIAEARASLPSIIDEVESGAGVELTRRGKPVAVMVSMPEYARLRQKRTDFKEAYRHFLKGRRLHDVGVEPEFAGELRDRAVGRKVPL